MRIGCVTCAVVVITAVGCSPAQDFPGAPKRDQREGGRPAKSISASRLAMGSTLTLTAWTADEAAAKSTFDDAFAEFARLEKLMSTWIADSDVSRINIEAGVRPVA